MIFLDTDGFFNSELVNQINTYSTVSGNDQLSATVGVAKGLAAIAILLTFSIRAYGMMAGEKKLELLPLLRPFVLLMVVVNFSTFSDMVKYPFSLINTAEQGMFDSNVTTMEMDYSARSHAIDSLIDQTSVAYANLLQGKANTDHANDPSFFSDPLGATASAVGSTMDNIAVDINKYLYKAENKIQFAMMCTVEWVMMGILKIIYYLMMMVSAFFLAVLVVLGPLSFGMSAFSGFQQTYIGWISRFISVCLYKGTCFIVLNICVTICDMAIQHDIRKIDYLISEITPVGVFDAATADHTLTPEQISTLLTNPIGDLDLLFAIVCVGAALSLLTVPTITTWVVSTQGISPAVASMGRRAAGMASAAAGAAVKGVKATTSGGGGGGGGR